MILSSPSGEVVIAHSRWWEALDAARGHGWRPAGTVVDGAGPYWNGAYSNHGFHEVWLTNCDAAALAEALHKRGYPLRGPN